MKGEKGNLKNRLKEWKLRRKYQKKKKEAKEVEEKNISNSTKGNDFITVQTITEKGKRGLLKIFGFLFAILESLSTSLYKKSNNSKKLKEESKDDSLIIIEDDTVQEENKIVNIEKNEDDTLPNVSYKNKYIVDVVQEPYVLDINIKEQQPEKTIIKDIEYITNGIDNAYQDLNTIVESNNDVTEKRGNIISLKEEVQHLKKHYHNYIANKKELLEETTDIVEIDPYKLIASPKELNHLLQQCDNELSKIKKQRKENTIFITKKEIDYLTTVIEENLKEQQEDINELKELFNSAELKQKRATLVTGIHNFLSKTINIGLSLLPLKICKNKLIGMLGSTVVLNNRLRSMRKIMRKENKNIDYITYKNISHEIKSQKLCMVKTKEILEDSMHQIKNLKQEFIMEFYYDMDRYPETEDIMTELASIEYQITSKNIELEEMLQTIQDVEVAEKQKVKVMEG